MSIFYPYNLPPNATSVKIVAAIQFTSKLVV